MTAASVLLRGRAAIERLMVDTCTITRITGDPTTLSTGQVVPQVMTVYSGKCRASKGGASGVKDVEHAGEPSTHALVKVSLPWSAPEIEMDDLVRFTVSADPTLLTRTMRVRYQDRGTHQTGRRLFCEETQT